jgi:hypothetical protein
MSTEKPKLEHLREALDRAELHLLELVLVDVQDTMQHDSQRIAHIDKAQPRPRGGQ